MMFVSKAGFLDIRISTRYHEVVNGETKHLYHTQISWNNQVRNKTNP